MTPFEKYNKRYPQNYKAFVKFAKKAQKKGFGTYSPSAILEEMRHHHFRIINAHRADYARKMIVEYPEFEGFFRIKYKKK